jgi:hypothetical protein
MNAPSRHPVAIVSERPFGKLRRIEAEWDKPPSIAEILDAQTDVTDYFRAHCVARVVDQVVPREMWRHVRPKPYCIRGGQVIDVRRDVHAAARQSGRRRWRPQESDRHGGYDRGSGGSDGRLRRRAWPARIYKVGGLREHSAVGAFAQLTAITADAITTKIIHRWPDEIGKPITGCHRTLDIPVGD